VSFFDALRTVIAKYADFEGRAGRAEFWWWMLFIALGHAAFGVFSVIPVGVEGASLGSILTGLWTIATLLPTLAVGVRRLRDAEYTWQNIFWILVPIGGLIVLAIYWAKPSTAVTEPQAT
jgi:uncharacterized membrane protein YhaH (DUF805 family)